MIEYLDGR